MSYNLKGTISENKREAERIYAVSKQIVSNHDAAKKEAQLRAESYYALNGQNLTGSFEGDVEYWVRTLVAAAPKVASLAAPWRIDGDMLVVCTMSPDARSGQAEMPLMAVPPMTADELRDAHHRLGLSANSAANLFMVSDGRTVRRWWSGERDIPGPVMVLTRALLESKSVRNFFRLKLEE